MPSLRFAKLGVVALVLTVLVIAHQLGVFARFAEPKTLADSLVAMGVWGYIAFVVAYTLLQPFGVPGTIFIVAAPLIWPWHTAFALSMTGTMGASVVGFTFARFVAKDWVSARIPARLHKYDESLRRNAFPTVVVLRLLLWMPPMLHAFFGVSKVRFWTHFWGSLIGYLPPLFLVSYLGGDMFDLSGNIRPGAWPVLGGLVIASVVIAVLSRLYERRFLQRSATSPDAPAQVDSAQSANLPADSPGEGGTEPLRD
ncbi:MAG: TVP38/TMEM64 family protein [Polyangiaceae bacterium]|nr:TVP38/TMEM64 family protein [Polyangiaceae bacterium]